MIGRAVRSARDATWAATVGACAAVLAAAVPRGGLVSSEGFGDRHLYRAFAERILAGELPYRDFFVEYPPGALPVFVLPTAAGGQYAIAFKVLMALLGGAAVGFAALALGRLGRHGVALWAPVLAAALVPALLATLSVNTYDVWPAFLATVAIWALLGGRAPLALAFLGLATAAKLVPAVLLPLFLLHVARTAGRRAAGRAALAFGAAGAVVTLPFVLLAPGGVGFSLEAQATRGLHSDSVPASLLFVADGSDCTTRRSPWRTRARSM